MFLKLMLSKARIAVAMMIVKNTEKDLP